MSVEMAKGLGHTGHCYQPGNKKIKITDTVKTQLSTHCITKGYNTAGGKWPVRQAGV